MDRERYLRHTYDHRWKEKVINAHCIHITYVDFAIKGIGFLVVTWTTVVLLGGFVSMIDKPDFWRLTLITLVQILWINANFFERALYTTDLLSSLQPENLYLPKRKMTEITRGGRDPTLALTMRVCFKIFVAAVRLVPYMVLGLCLASVVNFFALGLLITTSLSIYGLVKRGYYGDMNEGRTNMYPAHNVVYVMCVCQGALFLYILLLGAWKTKMVNQVSQAYGFQDGGRAVLGYSQEIRRGCKKKPSSARERNLVTYAIELMESKLHCSCLSGILILDTLLMQQYSGQIKAPALIQQEEEKQQQQLDLEDKNVHQLIKKEKEVKEQRKKKREERRKKRQQQREEAIIAQQRTVIKRLIGSASSTHILQKLLDTLDSKRSYDKMREAAARLVEHVAGGIRLEQFPRGINCISSLINNFEEYRRLQPCESSSPSNTNEKKGDDHKQERNNSYSSSESEPEPSEPSSEYSESEPESESYNGINRPSSSKLLNGYRDLVLTGLSILLSLAGSEDNCIILSKTKHLVSKIMAPVSNDLVHRTNHSAWSTSVVEASMRVMLRLMATAKDNKGDTEADLCQQISNSGAITTMEKIVTCEECKGGELQMTAIQILMQISLARFTKMLVELFIKGDCSDVSIRNTAGKELGVLFLSNKSGVALLPKEENDEFLDGLAEIVSQVANDAACRKTAAEILEHMCIHYIENDEYLSTLPQEERDEEYLRKKGENDEYLSTLKNALASVIPKVLREILLGCGLTGEEEKAGYVRPGTDIESQKLFWRRLIPDNSRIKKKNNKKNNNNNKNKTYSTLWQNQHHKLYVALLSLYVTVCEKLHLDIDAISPGEGDQGEGVALRFAMRMVQSNKDNVSADSLTVIKLSTRMVIATMVKFQETIHRVTKSADLKRLMDSLASISETMLDLEGSMVFAAGTTTLVPSTADTLNSLVKRAHKLHSEISHQDWEIVPAS